MCVIVKLNAIKRKDFKRTHRASKVSYAANTVTYVTIFHIARYGSHLHFEITQL